MRMKPRCTILIITKGNKKFLDRITEYYNPHIKEFNFLIANSGDKYDTTIPQIMFAKDIDPYMKISKILNMIETKYVVVCADDDFIVPNAICKCINFLELNNDYIVCHGLYKRVSHYHNWFVWSKRYNTVSTTDEHQFNRFQQHLNNYMPTLYAVHRTDIMKKAFNEFAKSNVGGWVFGELLTSILDSIYGKIKILPIFYCARYYPLESVNGKELGWHIKHDLCFNNKLVNFKRCLERNMRGSGISRFQLRLKINKNVNNYVTKCINQKKTMKYPLPKIIRIIYRAKNIIYENLKTKSII